MQKMSIFLIIKTYLRRKSEIPDEIDFILHYYINNKCGYSDGVYIKCRCVREVSVLQLRPLYSETVIIETLNFYNAQITN